LLPVLGWGYWIYGGFCGDLNLRNSRFLTRALRVFGMTNLKDRVRSDKGLFRRPVRSERSVVAEILHFVQDDKTFRDG